ncbi:MULTISPECIES: ABC transporter permease [Microbacterium]|uniref:ABC transporter permease n=1 Tax=Microbacterium TaxID=33882 RepID=UPI000700A7A3|nr:MULTISPECIES: ABC transporter permease [Microbacterium]KQP71713.1 peptide ABC transporter permease [Microbacterium sp. Leaf288]MDR7111674.1 peptide/nickel transport system permease protein [Microbacterium trichothecenolyticum]MDR7186553.1 peptide/nickel transport system permease protein [Microbacterium trichothecenolyticum]
MKFYARRIAFYVVTLWATISLNFLLPRLLPGDPADILLAKMQRAGGELSETTVRNIKTLLGGDTSSMWDQYVAYWGRMLQGDLGVSITKYPAPVTDLIAAALPWTVILVGLATVISFVLGVGIGAWVGWRRGTWVDHLVPFTTVLQSIPYFWLALVLVAIFSVALGWFPIFGGYDVWAFPEGPEWSWAFIGSAVYHGFLPALTIVLSSVGGWLLGMRNMMVSTVSEDYIVTAEAKGLKPVRILRTYATRNAAIPSIAGFGISLGFVVAGSIVMEQVFTYPGIGKLMIQSVQNSDYALMQGVFLVITIAVLAANFIMDIVYGFIDPRARHNV